MPHRLQADLGQFKAKFNLPFTLLADVDHAVAERYGLWVEKLFWGRKYMGVERTTYIIGPDGKIRTIFAKVNPDGHAADVRPRSDADRRRDPRPARATSLRQS